MSKGKALLAKYQEYPGMMLLAFGKSLMQAFRREKPVQEAQAARSGHVGFETSFLDEASAECFNGTIQCWKVVTMEHSQTCSDNSNSPRA